MNNEFIDIFGTKVKTTNILILIVVLIAGWFGLHYFFATEVPGDWLEKGTYQTQLYVNLFPNNDKTKNYRLVGEVERFTDCSNTDSEGNTQCTQGYLVSKITFPNNGYLEFNDCNLILNKKEYCTDTHGEGWNVELTNQKP